MADDRVFIDKDSEAAEPHRILPSDRASWHDGGMVWAGKLELRTCHNHGKVRSNRVDGEGYG